MFITTLFLSTEKKQSFEPGTCKKKKRYFLIEKKKNVQSKIENYHVTESKNKRVKMRGYSLKRDSDKLYV